MKFIISSDAWKTTLTSKQATRAIAQGLQSVDPTLEIVEFPIADGGEGTLDALMNATRGTYKTATVHDPLGRPVEAKYGVTGLSRHTCVIEMAQASGFSYVKKHEQNPRLASTFGTGELIRAALDEGHRNFVLAIGSSATNDGGAGMLRALGLKFLDKEGQEMSGDLVQLKHLDRLDDAEFDKRLQECTFAVVSDVQIPYIGPQGATRLYGETKGLQAEESEEVEAALQQLADVIEAHTGVRLHDRAGAGSGGGLGGAVQAFFPTKWYHGIDFVLKRSGWENALSGVTHVITGEGRLDAHTFLEGKGPHGVAKFAGDKGLPVTLFAGSGDIDVAEEANDVFNEVVVLATSEKEVEQALEKPEEVLRQAAARWYASKRGE
ncbi:glycerate kinase [Chryseomicrobium aureum]|uniref:glycerate kinase n=1 Tax=Chryseomicrobium aureum TaxID=1441723 RepID=UPI00370DAD31